MEKDNELIPITLWIAERGYRIKIKKNDEEAIRLAVKKADEQITDFRRLFAGKDDQDFVAMCLLKYAADQVTEEHYLAPSLQFKIESMIERIDKTLHDDEI